MAPRDDTQEDVVAAAMAVVAAALAGKHETDDALDESLGDPGPGLISTGLAAVSGAPTAFSPGARPLGWLTGAPPRSLFRSFPVIPFSAVGPFREPTLVVEGFRTSRVAVFTAPVIGFRIFIGESGVRPGLGLVLPPGQPYEVIIPGNQQIYAVTDAPTYVPLQIQVSAILMGDRERRF